MTTRQKIVEAANRIGWGGHRGGFVNTDGDWCLTRTPQEFKAFLEQAFGFKVVACKATAESTAIAVTADGYKIAWNGYCRTLK